MANNDIDLGLAVLVSVASPGDVLSLRDIADCCGCTKNTIFEIEKRALKKMGGNPVMQSWAGVDRSCGAANAAH